MRGRGGNRGRGRNSNGGSHGRGGAPHQQQQRYRTNATTSNDARPTCQVYDKKGHTAIECWYRFDESYGANNKSAGSAYGMDTNWYVDSGASDHVTGDLEKLSTRDRYGGKDQIKTANDSCMEITHTLVILLFKPIIMICILIIFFMPLKLQRILYPFITLLSIILHTLNSPQLLFGQGLGNEEHNP
jgi:hypothetical protein